MTHDISAIKSLKGYFIGVWRDFYKDKIKQKFEDGEDAKMIHNDVIRYAALSSYNAIYSLAVDRLGIINDLLNDKIKVNNERSLKRYGNPKEDIKNIIDTIIYEQAEIVFLKQFEELKKEL